MVIAGKPLGTVGASNEEFKTGTEAACAATAAEQMPMTCRTDHGERVIIVCECCPRWDALRKPWAGEIFGTVRPKAKTGAASLPTGNAAA